MVTEDGLRETDHVYGGRTTRLWFMFIVGHALVNIQVLSLGIKNKKASSVYIKSGK